MNVEKLLIVTLGDPFSINIEAISALLVRAPLPPYPILLLGSWFQWQDQLTRLGRQIEVTPISGWEAIGGRGLYFWDQTPETVPPLPASQLSAVARGELATAPLWRLQQLPAGLKVAVLTAPIEKKACALAGFAYPGHTEFFCELWQQLGIMILAGPRLRVGLVTNHEAIAALPRVITESLVYEKIQLFGHSLAAMLPGQKIRIAVCGLNPHAGDQGLFGDEEARAILPAVERARAVCTWGTISGPHAADTLFHRAYHGEFDGVLAMYHDQGLGPLKTVHFYDAVNITGGLPHFRVSPDHGPAQDLFLKGKADITSFQCAMSGCDAYLQR